MAQADKIGQAMQLFSVLANNTDWDSVDWETVQRRLIDKPKDAGKRFNAFLELAGNFDEKKAAKPSVLKALDGVTVGPQVETFDDRKFFKTRNGLWVSDEFTRRTKAIKIVVESTEPATLKRFDLVKNAYDREIKNELPQKHEVQLWQIAKLIEAQEGGTDGPLLNNGYWNTFYVSGFVVDVHWHGDYREWLVRARHLDDDRWLAGNRVFSSN